MYRSLTLLLLLFTSGCSFVVQTLGGGKPQAAPLLHEYERFTTDSTAVKNLNPNPEGEPWMVGGLVLPSAAELDATPRFPIDQALQSLHLPERVDNSQAKYWRGIFSQRHGSCAQASAIGYVYTYEVNRLRGKNANNPHDRYPTHWTYNFVNNGYDRGSWMAWGWEVGKSLGIPSVKAYGTETGFDLQYWPSDYAVYEDAFNNKVEKYWIMQVSTPTGIDTLKRYLYDHGTVGGEGGIVSFAAGWSTGYAEGRVPDDRYLAGKKVITSFGKIVNHAITFVGYDDLFCWDYNQDGRCTNDIDLNGDDRIDVKDWENGAFLMANSWGTDWGDGGFIYVPYRLAATDPSDGGIYEQIVYGVVPALDKDLGMAVRVRMTHDKRNQLRFLSTFRSEKSTDNDAQFYRYYGLQNSGGAYPLNGKTNDPVDFGLDLRNLLAGVPADDLTRVGVVLDSLGGVGNIEKVEVIDYANGRIVEARDHDVEIKKGRTVVEAQWQGDPDPDPDPEPLSCSVGPVAVPGHDLTVNEYCVHVIDGSMSFDPDSENLQYQWTQAYGRVKLELENADTAKVTVYVPKVKRNEYVYLRLTVKDEDGFVDSDTIRIYIVKR